MLNHARQHGLPISLQRGTSEEELRAALHYGAHSSAVKDVDFVHQELTEQVQSGHIVVFLLATVCNLPKLWLYPVAAIPQVGRRPHLFLDFTWRDLNKATAQEAPEEVIRFGGTLHHIIRRILLVDPQLGPVYLGKVDLADAYMPLWVHLEDISSVGFLVPRNILTYEQLVGFHLSLLMGYVDSAPFLCLTKGLRKEPISKKKLRQGDAASSTKKTVVGWEIDTLEHHLRLMSKRKIKVCVALDAIPSPAH